MSGIKGKSGVYDNSKRRGMFKKGDMFWKGKKRSDEDKLKMSKPKKTRYLNLEIKINCKFCKKEFIKNSTTQLYCKTCAPTNKFTGFIRKYNMSHPQYLKMIEDCSGLCEICLKEKATDIDHDHKTGKVRGMLCGDCNKGLGFMKDNINILNGSVEYLERSTLQNYGR